MIGRWTRKEEDKEEREAGNGKRWWTRMVYNCIICMYVLLLHYNYYIIIGAEREYVYIWECKMVMGMLSSKHPWECLFSL